MNPTWLAFFLILQGRNTKTATNNKALTSTLITAMSPPAFQLPLAVIAARTVEDERVQFEKNLSTEFQAVLTESARIKGAPAADFLTKSAPLLTGIEAKHPPPAAVNAQPAPALVPAPPPNK